MIDEIKKIKSSRKDLRNFGLLVGGIFIILSLYFYLRHPTYAGGSLYVGIVLLLLGASSPFILKPVHKVWMTFGILMGFIVTNIILTLFFYLVITPFAFTARLVGKKFLDLSFKKPVATYWKKCHENKPMDTEKQF